MKFKICLLLFGFLFFLCELNAQTKMVQPRSICSGKMSDAKASRPQTICFVRSVNDLNNSTKYIIKLDEVEIFEVGIIYIRDYKDFKDSVFIYLFDKRSIHCESKAIKLKGHDSKILFADFEPNQKLINNEKNYDILFSIDKTSFEATLYQFKSTNGLTTYFSLQPVPENVINAHFQEIKESYEYLEGIKKEENEKAEALKARMQEYVSTTIKDIQAKERQKREVLSEVTDNELQEPFRKKMDSIILPYFKNIHLCSNEDFTANVNFYVDGYGNLVKEKTSFHFSNTPLQQHWFRDSFNLHILQKLESDGYNTPIIDIPNPTLKQGFDANFNESIRQLPESNFDEIISTAYAEFDKYRTRTIHVPIKYTYPLSYKSTKTSDLWKYSIKEGKIKLEDAVEKENIINDAIIAEFQKWVDVTGEDNSKITEKGKYTVEICEISVKGESLGKRIINPPTKK